MAIDNTGVNRKRVGESETMSIPDMPSTCQLWRPAVLPVLVNGNIACRVVPDLRVIGGPVAATAYSSISHWVDLPAGTYLQSGYKMVFSSPSSIVYTWDWRDADLIVVCSLPAGQRFFLVLGVETRYLDTADEYVRAWCHWVQSVPGFVDPC